MPPKLDNLTLQEFMDRLELQISSGMDDHNRAFEDDVDWIMNFISLNESLPLCRAITSNLTNKYDIALFMVCLVDYAQWADSADEGMQLETIYEMFPGEIETSRMRRRIKDGSHVLLKKNMLEYDCAYGMANPERLKITRSIKEKLLDTYVPSKSQCPLPKTSDRFLRNHKLIADKQLFYNKGEEVQISKLSSLLSKDNFKGIQQRLEEMGMRKGFAAIFYGAPGTGKTETVLQLAKATGRDIMQIDLAAMRDKWVGESEKNIKRVFLKYKELCKNCETEPILLFNEADAIFGRRNENATHSVDKMNNSMQNIILQEMEELEGIMIATTNMAASLDGAFERRFLFKVEFKKPEKEVKAKIWNHMFKGALPEEHIARLCERFDFTGGQIENIVRKTTIDYVLDGGTPQLTKISTYCEEEVLNASTHTKVGFLQ